MCNIHIHYRNSEKKTRSKYIKRLTVAIFRQNMGCFLHFNFLLYFLFQKHFITIVTVLGLHCHDRLSCCGVQIQFSCVLWDLSSPAGDQTHIPCTERQIPNDWTTRKSQLDNIKIFRCFHMNPSCCSTLRASYPLHHFRQKVHGYRHKWTQTQT